MNDSQAGAQDFVIDGPLGQIKTAFQKPGPALMPYFTIGYPDYETSLEVIAACAEAGADLIELGVPFSDPLADGPTIQYSSQVAIENGVTARQCIEAVRELRTRGVQTPFMLMGYYNPILAFGEADFVAAAASAGANGFIIPDLPPEEAAAMVALCRQHEMGLSFLLAPNSTLDRITSVAEVVSGFTYLVSVTGITGAVMRCLPSWPISSSGSDPISRPLWRSDLGSPLLNRRPELENSPRELSWDRRLSKRSPRLSRAEPRPPRRPSILSGNCVPG